jgi:hypothetical protein
MGIFNLINTSSRTTALGLTEKSSWGVKRARRVSLTSWPSCGPIVWKMWEPRCLTTLWASTACYNDRFNLLYFYTYKCINGTYGNRVWTELFEPGVFSEHGCKILCSEKELLSFYITVTILDIIHRPPFCLKTRRFGDWVLSPSSGRTYSDRPNSEASLSLSLDQRERRRQTSCFYWVHLSRLHPKTEMTPVPETSCF